MATYSIGDKISTPRGTFEIVFNTLQGARKEGYGLHHRHTDDSGNVFAIVSKDNSGVAVMPTTMAESLRDDNSCG